MTATQLALDLFPDAKPRDPEAECLRWLVRRLGVPRRVVNKTIREGK